MSNHVHLIAQSRISDLSGTLRDMKKYTSNKIIEAIEIIPESRREWLLNQFRFNANKHNRNSKYQVWTHENHAMLQDNALSFCEKIDHSQVNTLPDQEF